MEAEKAHEQRLQRKDGERRSDSSYRGGEGLGGEEEEEEEEGATPVKNHLQSPIVMIALIRLMIQSLKERRKWRRERGEEKGGEGEGGRSSFPVLV